MNRRLIAILLVALVPSVAAAGPRERETRFFDLGAIVAQFEERPFVALGPLRGTFHEYWSGDDHEPTFLTGERLVSLLGGRGVLVHPHEIRQADEQMVVTAEPEDLSAVTRAVTDLWHAATRRVRVDVRLLELPVAGWEGIAATEEVGGLDGGKLSAKAAVVLVDLVRRAGGTVREASLVSRPALRTSVGRVSARVYLKDHDVELAGGSVIGDPVVGWLREGWAVDVRPHLLAGSGVFLEVMLQEVASLGPMRTLDLEAENLGRVELPSLSRRILYSTGCVSSGEVMAVSVAGPERVGILLLTPHATGRPVSGFLPVSALRDRPTSGAMSWSDEDGGFRSRSESSEPVPALWPPRIQIRNPSARQQVLLEDLAADVHARLAVEHPKAWSAAGHGVLLPFPAGLHAAARKVVAAHEARLLRTVPVRVRVVQGKREIFAAQLQLIPGREVCVSDGVLRAYVGDWSVEVAEYDARIGDPEVQWAWGGVALNLRLDAGPVPGVYAARITGEVATLSDEFTTLRTGNTVTGIVESPRGQTIAVEQFPVLAAGRPHAFQPAEGLRIEVTAGE